MLKQKRLISAVWLLITYFSLDYVLVAFSGAFSHIQKYSGRTVDISQEMINLGLLFVLIYNLIFLICGDYLSAKFGTKRNKVVWTLPKNLPPSFQYLKNALLAIFFISVPLTMMMYSGSVYRDYVERTASSWPYVFYQCALPVISICCLQKKYIWALFLSVPSIILSYQMGVRSFLLPTLVAIGFIYVFQSVNFKGGMISLLKNAKLVFGACLIMGSLVIISFVTKSNKSKTEEFAFTLPDYGMAKQSLIVFTIANDGVEQTGVDSINLYLRKWFNPARKVLGLKGGDIVDPATKMAYMWEGIKTDGHSKYLHYPSLIYSDSYLAIGFKGLVFAFLWCFVCHAMEAVMARNSYLMSLCIPFFMWHSYMLVRGAVAGAADPFSYAFYLTAFISLLLCNTRLIRKKT